MADVGVIYKTLLPIAWSLSNFKIKYDLPVPVACTTSTLLDFEKPFTILL